MTTSDFLYQNDLSVIRRSIFTDHGPIAKPGQNGKIADDPADVVVRVNGTVVSVESVSGLLGQVVLTTEPAANASVEIDYDWIRDPVVEIRRLNSKEFRLNNWGNDLGSQVTNHKYRYRNTLVRPATYAELELQATLDQPLQRDLKYRALERAYSVSLNDPNTLVLNAPNHRVAYPPLSRRVTSSFVNYEATVLPESDPVAPWVRHGTGDATLQFPQLVVVDNTTGPAPGGSQLFWTQPIDLTFPHVYAIGWRMQLDPNSTSQGVFTGVAAGYTDQERAIVVGYLMDGSTPKLGVLRSGFGNDPSTLAAWTGGMDPAGALTGDPIDLDWTAIRSYRIFKDKAGGISVFIDGSVVAALKVAQQDLPFLEELNAPFNTLQGAFFGSLSREAANVSTWNFVRHTTIPTNPIQTAPATYVDYDASVLPEVATAPWTPVGFHGSEKIVGGALVLDSTSASGSEIGGLIDGDFRGYTRIEPLLAAAYDIYLDVNVAIRTYTHGITPNAVMAAVDDGKRLMQLCFLAQTATPKISYGGRVLPENFSTSQPWQILDDGASAEMVGQYLEVTDTSTSTGLVYYAQEPGGAADDERVVSYLSDYMLESRLKVLSYTPDMNGFCGATFEGYDSQRSVGLQLIEVAGVRYIEFHSEGVALVGKRAAFDWFDGKFHTFRVVKSTFGALVTAFVDSVLFLTANYIDFEVTPFTPSGMVQFGSSTAFSKVAKSKVQWGYANFWRVSSNVRKYVGVWKGTDPNSLTGYHLPLRVENKLAVVNGNVLADQTMDFVAKGVLVGDQLIIDYGDNKGVYPVASVGVHQLTITGAFPSQPATIDYRVAYDMDWSTAHRYRMVKNPSGGVVVIRDAETSPCIQLDYSALTLPSSSGSLGSVVSGGLPSVLWGAFDSANISQTSWDYVRYGAVRSLTEAERQIAPQHMVLNQRNIIASFEHHQTNIPHQHTNFWSESEGIPPAIEPDLLKNPHLTAFTLLNEGTPLVPSTQSFGVRKPYPVRVPLNGSGEPLDTTDDGVDFGANDGAYRIEIVVPDDVLYNSLEVIETQSGELGLIAPFDDEVSLGSIQYQKTQCLTYTGKTLLGADVLPENDVTPWQHTSVDSSHQFTSLDDGVLTYGTDSIGTQTSYSNTTPLLSSAGLSTQIRFRIKILQDSSDGLGDSQVRVGFSSPGMVLGLAFVTTEQGERYVLVLDLHSTLVVGGLPFDFYDGAFHDYTLTRDPATQSVRLEIDTVIPEDSGEPDVHVLTNNFGLPITYGGEYIILP